MSSVSMAWSIDWGWNLYNAAHNDNLDNVIAIITAHGEDPHFDINYKNQFNGYTPLYIACAWGFISTKFSTSGYYEIVKILLEHGADPNIANEDGKTPLWIAASWGHYHIVRLLISKGANLNVQVSQDTSFFTPLQIAAYFQRFTESKYTTTGEHHAYYMAIDYIKGIMNTEKGLKYFPEIEQDYEMLKNYTADDPKNHVPVKILRIVSKYNHFAVVEELVSAGADINIPDEKGYTALHKATQLMHVAIVKLLVEHGGVMEDTSAMLSYGKKDQLLGAATNLGKTSEFNTVHGTPKLKFAWDPIKL